MTGPFEGKQADVTDKVIKAFYKVYNQLGYGFSEKVYQNATAHLARKLGLQVETEKGIEVGLLLNFGPKPDFIRRVYDNTLKGPLSWTDWTTPPAPPQ